MRARPSLRANGSREYAPDRHCEQSEAIQSRKKGWIASSLTLLAMTGWIPAQGVLRPSLRANGSRECAPEGHCEPTGRANARPTVIASEAKQSISPNKERLDCFVADAPRNDGTGYRRKEF